MHSSPRHDETVEDTIGRLGLKHRLSENVRNRHQKVLPVQWGDWLESGGETLLILVLQGAITLAFFQSRSDCLEWAAARVGEDKFRHAEAVDFQETAKLLCDPELYRAGVKHDEAGEYAEAVSLFRESIALFRRELGEEHEVTLAAMRSLARAEAQAGGRPSSWCVGINGVTEST